MQQGMLKDIGILARAKSSDEILHYPLVSIVFISESKVISTSVSLHCYAEFSASLKIVETIRFIEKFDSRSEL